MRSPPAAVTTTTRRSRASSLPPTRSLSAPTTCAGHSGAHWPAEVCGRDAREAAMTAASRGVRDRADPIFERSARRDYDVVRVPREHEVHVAGGLERHRCCDSSLGWFRSTCARRSPMSNDRDGRQATIGCTRPVTAAGDSGRNGPGGARRCRRHFSAVTL